LASSVTAGPLGFTCTVQLIHYNVKTQRMKWSVANSVHTVTDRHRLEHKQSGPCIYGLYKSATLPT